MKKQSPLIRFGTHALRLTPTAAIVARRGDSKHLTVPFAPRQDGRYKGAYTPHISFPRRGPQARRTLGRIRPEDVQRFVEALTRTLLSWWRAATRRVDLRELEREGWVVVLTATDSVPTDQFAAIFRAEPGVYEIDDARVTRAFQFVQEHVIADVVLPRDLEHQPESSTPYVAVRDGCADEPERLWLRRFGTAWYGTAGDWLDSDRLRDEILRAGGPGLLRALARIAQELGIQLQG